MCSPIIVSCRAIRSVAVGDLFGLLRVVCCLTCLWRACSVMRLAKSCAVLTTFHRVIATLRCVALTRCCALLCVVATTLQPVLAWLRCVVDALLCVVHKPRPVLCVVLPQTSNHSPPPRLVRSPNAAGTTLMSSHGGVCPSGQGVKHGTTHTPHTHTHTIHTRTHAHTHAHTHTTHMHTHAHTHTHTNTTDTRTHISLSECACA